MYDVASFLAGYCVTILTPGPNMIMIASKAMVDGRSSTRRLIVGLCVGTIALYAAMRVVAAAVSSWIDLSRVGPLLCGAALLFVAYAVAPIHRRARIDPNARPVRQDMDALGVRFGLSTALFNPITASYFLSQMLRPGAALIDGAASAITIAGLFLLCAGRNFVVASVFSAPRWRAAALWHEQRVRLALCTAMAGYAGWTAAPQLPDFGAASHGRLAASVVTGLSAFALAAALRATHRPVSPRRPLRRDADVLK